MLSATSAQFTTAKHQAARMPRWIAVDQNLRAGGGDTQGWQFEICKLHNNWDCACTQENVRFIMWLLYVQLLRGQNRYGLVCAVMINPPELPINDETRNESHIASTGVGRY